MTWCVGLATVAKVGRGTQCTGLSPGWSPAAGGPAWLLALLAVTLAGCGEYPGVAHPLAGQATPGAAVQPAAAGGPAVIAPAAGQSGQPAGVSRPAGGAGTAGAGAAQPATAAQPAAVAPGSAQVQLKDFRLEPNQLAVRAGSVRFELLNRGRYTHDFRIRSGTFEQQSPKVGAGRELTWEVTLAAGEYELSCPISDHAERGMTGKLVVSRS